MSVNSVSPEHATAVDIPWPYSTADPEFKVIPAAKVELTEIIPATALAQRSFFLDFFHLPGK
jgi:hypothetical protein